MTRGKYIVLEGPEGVGKTTQLAELGRRMRAAGLAVRTLREPDSQSDLTARAIRQLTQDPQYPMNTRTEVLLYNAARSQSLQAIKNSLGHGVHCLVDRNYLTTLAVQFYGRGDVPDYYTINNIINFAVGGLEPDLTIILDAPVLTLKERSNSRFSKERFDNLDDAFLERVRAGYLWEAKQRGYPLVFASREFDEVAADIWKLTAQTLATRGPQKSAPSAAVSVQQVLSDRSIDDNSSQRSPDQASATNEPDYLTLLKAVAKQPLPDYLVPERMNKQTAKIFKDGIDGILAKRVELLNKLKASRLADDEATWLTLPAACYFAGKTDFKITDSGSETLRNAAAKLGGKHPKFDDHPVKLSEYWPHNELSLVPASLFGYSELSLEELSQATDSWSYDQKARIIQNAQASDILASVGYSWEVLTDLATLLALEQQDGVQTSRQRLTPRYGFETPRSIEKAGLTELFEACFDASLDVFSQLQAAGCEAQAQLATLAGHTHRAKVTMSAATLRQLQSTKTKAPQNLAKLLAEATIPVHPLVAQVTIGQNKATRPKRNLQSAKPKKHN